MNDWTCERYGVAYACPECGSTGALEKEDRGEAHCCACGVWFSTWRVKRVESYGDPHVVSKCHEVARSYHRMRGDIGDS